MVMIRKRIFGVSYWPRKGIRPAAITQKRLVLVLIPTLLCPIKGYAIHGAWARQIIVFSGNGKLDVEACRRGRPCGVRGYLCGRYRKRCSCRF